MRAVSSATASLLANPPPGLQAADLFTFTLRDFSATYCWTSYDTDLTVNGTLYSSRKPWLKRSRWNIANNMQVPTLEVSLLALNDAFSGGIDIKGQLTNGLFDGAFASLDRVLFSQGTTVINDNAGGYRYFKLNIDATINGGAGVEIAKWELAAFPGGPSLILNKTATASSNNGPSYVPQHAVDTSGFGWESAAGLPQWIKVDMGSAYSAFTPVEMRLRNNGAETPTTFELYGSNDDVTYTLIQTWTSYTGWITTGLSPLSTTLGVSADFPAHPGIRLFGGKVANIDIDGNSAIINIKGKSTLLDQSAPRNVYQLGCMHAFCDAGCTLGRSTYTAAGLQCGSAGLSRTFIPWNGTPPPNPSNYRYGTITMKSGACSGQSRTVRKGDSTGLTLTHPLIGTPNALDYFDVFQGCDKQLNSGSGQDCTARSNTQHWRAFPYVPPADTAF